MRRQIISIEQGGTSEGQVKVLLSDGSSFFLHRRTIPACSLSPGIELDEQDVERILLYDRSVEAERKGLDLLAMREHSRIQLRTKLLRREFPPEAVEAAMQRLAASGALDEERFARSWVESRLRRRPEGPGLLRAGLASRGIDRETADRVVGEAVDDEVLEAALGQTVEKLRRKSGMTDERLVSRLISRGFPIDRIRRYLNRSN